MACRIYDPSSFFKKLEERNALQEDTEPYLHEILDQQTIRSSTDSINQEVFI